MAKLPGAADHRPGRGRRPATTSGGRGPGTTSAAPRRARTTSTQPARARNAAGRHAGDGLVQVEVGHRVGLRLRLRHDARRTTARRTRRSPSANGYTTPASAEPERRTPARRSTATASPARAGRMRPARRRSTDRSATTRRRGFLDDEYDLSAAVGNQTVLRFSYSTDPGLTRPGWFIDDLRITAGDAGHLRVRLRDDR